MSFVRKILHLIFILYLGRAVECVPKVAFHANRRHSCTQALTSAAPIPDPNLERISHRIKILCELPPLLDPSAN